MYHVQVSNNHGIVFEIEDISLSKTLDRLDDFLIQVYQYYISGNELESVGDGLYYINDLDLEIQFAYLGD